MDEIDETERQREAAMEIIAKAGAARSCAFAAIHRAKAFDFGGAAEQLDEAERYATEAHKVHTELLVREAGGQQTDGGLLVAHAQDHFMMATLAQELAEEIVEAALRRSGAWAGLDAAATGNAPDGAYRYALYEAHGAARVPYAYGIVGQQEAVNEDITCLQRGNVDRHSARGTDKVCKKGAASTGSEGCRGTCLQGILHGV